MKTRSSKPQRPTPDQDALIRTVVDQVEEGRLRNHLDRLIGVRHHSADPDALESAADYITEQFQSFGLKTRNHWFDAFGHRNRNIIASFSNRPPAHLKKEPVLIVGAHYDSVSGSPGADDNASGVAVMLETARLIRNLNISKQVLFIAFAQEEQHCLGSTLYAIKTQKAGGKIQGVIVLECVGYASDEPRSQQTMRWIPMPIPDVANFLGVIGNTEAGLLKEVFEKSATRYVPDLPVVSLLVPDAGHGFPGSRRSDHSPFWDAGYPALMLTDTANFRNPQYHQPGDQINTLSFSYMSKVARAAIAFLAQISVTDLT